MPRARNPNRDKAFEIYKKHNGEIDLVEIASQLNISAGTVRGWKSKDKWNQKLNGTFQKNTERSKKKKEVIAKDVEQVLKNAKLTDKQRLFCLHYVRCFNATKAYQKAYGCDYISAMQNGSRLLRNDKVKSEILRLKKERFNKDLLSEEDIFQKYMDIAFADITDYVSFGTRQAVDGKTGEEYETSFVHLKDSREVDGTLISEVSKGKDGAKIKLADRMKALQWLSGHMDMATEEQKARIGLLKLQQKKIEQENSSGYDDGVEIVNDAPKKED